MKIDDQLITFPFKDERWASKFLVGGLLSLCGFLIPLTFIPLSGYMVRVMRRTESEGVLSLPAWDDWGDLILSGLKAWLVTIVYSLPLWVTMFCGYGAMVAGGLIAPFGAAEESVLPVIGGVALVLMGLAAFGVGMILAFPVMFLAPIALVRMVADDSLNSAFQFGEVWRELKTGFKEYIVAFLVYLALSMGASMVATLLFYTICLTCLAPFAMAAAVVYAMVMEGALFGLAYRETRALAGGGPEQVEAAG
jgi:hypothetical protein